MFADSSCWLWDLPRQKVGTHHKFVGNAALVMLSTAYVSEHIAGSHQQQQSCSFDLAPAQQQKY